MDTTMNIVISDHFSMEEVIFSETAERRGINNSLPQSLIPVVKNTASNMEDVRNLLGHPIHVNSWYRCPSLNTAVGSSLTSQHIKGEAVDFICPAFGTPLSICKKILSASSTIKFDQLILEHSWVHISFCSNPGAVNRREVLSLLNSGGYSYGLTNKNGIKYG